jgi:hypothetical protein
MDATPRQVPSGSLGPTAPGAVEVARTGRRRRRASTGSAAAIAVLRWGILLALLGLRRFRHLLVFLGSLFAVLLAVRLATVDRPRPFGVDLHGGWAGWAMPSRPVAILAGARRSGVPWPSSSG